MAWQVSWDSRTTTVAIGNREELTRLLRQAAKEAKATPQIVELRSEHGYLGIGVGRPESVASWQRTLDPPYYASRGDASATGTIVFFDQGHWSEFPRTSAIPQRSALEAAFEFFATGERPANIEWEEV